MHRKVGLGEKMRTGIFIHTQEIEHMMSCEDYIMAEWGISLHTFHSPSSSPLPDKAAYHFSFFSNILISFLFLIPL